MRFIVRHFYEDIKSFGSGQDADSWEGLEETEYDFKMMDATGLEFVSL